jgi:hypothetical protein
MNSVIAVVFSGSVSLTDNRNLSLKVVGISWPCVVAKSAPINKSAKESYIVRCTGITFVETYSKLNAADIRQHITVV